MSKSEFLKNCGTEPQKNNSGYHDDTYNTWEKNCLKALFPRIEEYRELHEEIKQLLEKSKTLVETEAQRSESLSTLSVVSNSTSDKFTASEAAGIGTGAAVGGIALGGTGVALAPMIIKLFSRLFY